MELKVQVFGHTTLDVKHSLHQNTINTAVKHGGGGVMVRGSSTVRKLSALPEISEVEPPIISLWPFSFTEFLLRFTEVLSWSY